jgi:hypothetical protein
MPPLILPSKSAMKTDPWQVAGAATVFRPSGPHWGIAGDAASDTQSGLQSTGDFCMLPESGANTEASV